MTDNNNITPSVANAEAKVIPSITDFMQDVRSKLSLSHRNIYTIGAVVFALIFWMIKMSSDVDAGTKLMKEQNKILDKEIKDFKKQVKQDSLERIALYKKIDSLKSERSTYDQAIQRIDNRINSIKNDYGKISVMYTNLTIDSLNKLRSRFGE